MCCCLPVSRNRSFSIQTLCANSAQGPCCFSSELLPCRDTYWRRSSRIPPLGAGAARNPPGSSAPAAPRVTASPARHGWAISAVRGSHPHGVPAAPRTHPGAPRAVAQPDPPLRLPGTSENASRWPDVNEHFFNFSERPSFPQNIRTLLQVLQPKISVRGSNLFRSRLVQVTQKDFFLKKIIT